MSRIDELTQELCPQGVEHKTLGQAGEFIRGNGLQKADLRDKGVPAVHYGQIHTLYGVHATETRSFTDPEIAAKLRHAQPGDLLIATTSEDDDAVAKATAWLGDTDVVLSGDAYIYRHELDPKYVAYFFQSTSFQDQKRRFISGTKVRRVSGASLERIRIPVPPLEVQRKIVRVLEKFTELEVELEAELEARRSQRVALATNFDVAARDRAVQNVTKLGSIAHEVIDPVPVVAGQLYAGLGVKWRGEGVLVREARDGAEIKATTLYRAQPGHLIYNKMFVVEGSFAIVPAGCDRAVVSNEFPVFNIDRSKVEPFWLLQHLCNPHTLQRIEREVTGTERGTMKSRRRWKSSQFVDFEIDLPPLDEQREIVRVLRASDRLISSLECELAARRKQYEHYRDRLLTFKELAA